MRVEADRRTITVPVIGGLRAKENTRRRATPPRLRASPDSEHHAVPAVGAVVRVGRLRTAHPDHRAHSGAADGASPGWISGSAPWPPSPPSTPLPVPKPWSSIRIRPRLTATLAARRRAGRELSRRIRGSRGHRAAKAKLTRLDRRCVQLRREAAHQLTTELAGTYGHIVVEDLDLAAMKQGMGRRAFRRAVSDAAMGLIRPQLAYKNVRCGSTLTVADRWFASSQIHHGCPQPDGTPCRLLRQGPHRQTPDLPVRPARSSIVTETLHVISVTGRILPVVVQSGPRPHRYPGQPPRVGTGHGADIASSGAGGASVRPRPRGAGRGEAKTRTPQGDAA